MQKRSAAALISRHGLRRCITRGLSLLLCLVIMLSVISSFSVAYAGHSHTDILNDYGLLAFFNSWIVGTRHYDDVHYSSGGNGNYAVNQPQKYYTTPTSSVQDKYGNVTNYYRGGDTTTTNIIDSYNKTFNTIFNTTNNSTTNNYSANVKLENFLNSYTTNNNNYTYSADFKSWYYDNTTNNYNYSEFNKYETTNNYLYYNQDNSRYYISIDNSTDEYYLIDVQYSPTFVTVNYTYNTTNNNYGDTVGDVTNVYYYELKDGRNSSSLTAAEVAGMDFGYDVANYELVTDDPNTLSLQHFDGDYTDSSSYNRSFYSQNRSTTYVDSGAFGQAVSLPNGSAAGVTIPNLSSYDSLSFDFRIYYNDISKLGVYFGDTNIFQEVVTETRKWTGRDIFSDNGSEYPSSYLFFASSGLNLVNTEYYDIDYLTPFLRSTDSPGWTRMPVPSSTYKSQMEKPISYLSSGFEGEDNYLKEYGWMSYVSSSPELVESKLYWQYCPSRKCFTRGPDYYVSEEVWQTQGVLRHYTDYEYRWSPSQYVVADFSYDSYKNQWVSMRITISGGNLYYFVNGDLVGSGPFTKPTADKFYIKSTGTVYLDELRVTTGSLSSTSPYTPSSFPYDTNKVLALPDNLAANTIYVQHNIPITNHRIGGVRPSNPEKGFLYIPLYDDRTGAQPQLYDGSNWIDVTAMVYDGKSLKDAKGFKFSPVGDAPDVDVDAKPERPEKPVDPETCTHEWRETSRTDPTCTVDGSVKYTCSKCEKTKTETLSKLGHNWEVKEIVQPSYGEDGEIITQGFTVYRCSNCGEEYRTENGTGPPGIGDGTGNDILDKFPSFVNMVLSIFQQLPKLFEGFAAFLAEVFAYVPEDIILLLTFGVAAVVLIGIIKAVRG